MTRTLALLLLLAAAALPACDSINTVEHSETTGQEKRVITDAFLARYARIGAVTTTTLPGDILKVQVELTNTSVFDQQILYKFDWYDQAEMIVNTPLSTWQTRHFEARETIHIATVAPTTACKSFKLKLQEAKRN